MGWLFSLLGGFLAKIFDRITTFLYAKESVKNDELEKVVELKNEYEKIDQQHNSDSGKSGLIDRVHKEYTESEPLT